MSVININTAPKFGWRPSSAPLSPREIQCVELVYLTNEDIGLALGIAKDTVRANLRSVFIKLQVGTRAEAYAVWTEMQRERRAA